MGGLREGRRHYFDWSASAAPLHLEKGEAFFANPSSAHAEGRRAKAVLEESRRGAATLLGADPSQIYFVSGGTEAASIVLNSRLLHRGEEELLISAAEHPAMRESAQGMCRALPALGKRVRIIPINSAGAVDQVLLERALGGAAKPRFASIMAVNNETGAINDIPLLASLLHSFKGPPIHLYCDLVQALGKIPLNLHAWDVDSAGMSLHKIGGPPGFGILYLKKKMAPLFIGGGQEGGIRPGTENVGAAREAAGVMAIRLREDTLSRCHEEAEDRLAWLLGEIKKIDRAAIIPFDREARDRRFSPYIIQVAFRGIPGEVMVRSLDDEGIACSTGSACSTGKEGRPVLKAMGLDDETSFSGIRISQGWDTSMEDMEALASALRRILEKL